MNLLQRGELLLSLTEMLARWALNKQRGLNLLMSCKIAFKISKKMRKRTGAVGWTPNPPFYTGVKARRGEENDSSVWAQTCILTRLFWVFCYL